MKQTLHIFKKLLVTVIALAAVSLNAKADYAIDETTFPDENFRNFLTSQSYGSDGVLKDAELASITVMDVSRKSVASLKGIELFTALQDLDCSSNQLTELDLSQNTQLLYLECSQNQLTSLDVSGLTSLQILFCYRNKLQSLDVTTNTNLTKLAFFENEVAEIDVTNCTKLKELTCYTNNLSVLDVSHNSELTLLECYKNQLTSLNVSACTKLKELSCSNNMLTQLNLSNCHELVKVACASNRLVAFNVSNTKLTTSITINNNCLKGAQMDAFIASLPSVNSKTMLAITTGNDTGGECNVISTSQVAAAQEKGWNIITKVVNTNNGSTSMYMTVYNGSEETVDPCTIPLTLEILESGTKLTVSNTSGTTYEISYNGSDSWIERTGITDVTTTLPDGCQTVSFRGNNTSGIYISVDKPCYVYGNVMSMVSATDYATCIEITEEYAFYKMFGSSKIDLHPSKELVLPAVTLSPHCYDSMFSKSTLSRAPELPATECAQYCYYYMFNGCDNLTTAPELPATKLSDGCYRAMFQYCHALETAPAVLPAKKLEYECYDNMFRSCTALTTAPEFSATELAGNCCYFMFADCSKLEAAPLLPATSAANRCYMYMFYNCKELTQAADLPATTLAPNCYAGMFYGDSKLEKAPMLPAPVLVNGCYSYMFTNCEKLNYVKCLATDLSANQAANDWERATNVWLDGVAATGTFVTADGMEDWTIGTGGIPEGWTVSNATGIISPTVSPIIEENSYYTLDGRKLSGKPTQKGIYIHQGNKILIR